jgi:hypothetical protein
MQEGTLILHENCFLAPYNEILKILTTSFCSPCFAELISILLVKISGTVEKLFKG